MTGICIKMRQTVQNKLKTVCLKKMSVRQRQWLWFVGLWCSGLAAVLLLAYGIRLVMGID